MEGSIGPCCLIFYFRLTEERKKKKGRKQGRWAGGESRSEGKREEGKKYDTSGHFLLKSAILLLYQICRLFKNNLAYNKNE